MSKILLTNVNSVWGVIINPQSSNTYRHVLNFKTQDLKDKFINKELFGGADYKQLLAQQEEVAITQITATSADFVISPDQYPHETFSSLLNKDFAIVQEDGETKFYTLQPERNGNGKTILYKAELDIFFTYNITEMFNDRQTEVSRAHFDRVKYSGAFGSYNTNSSFLLDSPMYSPEPIQPLSKENLYPVITEYFTVDKGKFNITFDYNETNTTIPPQHKLDIEKHIWTETCRVPLKYLISQYRTNKGASYRYEPTPHKTIVEEQDIGLTVYLGNGYSPATGYKSSFETINNLTLGWAYILTQSNDFYFLDTDFSNVDSKLSIEATETIKQGGLGYAPFSLLHLLNLDRTTPINVKFTVVPISLNGVLRGYDFNITIDISNETFAPSVGGFVFNKNTSSGRPVCLINLRTPIITKLNAITSMNFSGLYDFQKKLKQPRRNDIGKINGSQFTQRIIETPTLTNKKIFIENTISQSNLFPIFRAGVDPGSQHYSIQIENYNRNYSGSNNNIRNSQLFEFVANYALPTSINAYNEYLSRNKASLNNSYLSKGLQAGVGIAGAVVAGVATGGIGALAVGLVGVAASAATGISSQIAKQKDIKNTPNNFVSNGIDLLNDLSNGKTIVPTITLYKPAKHILNSIEDFLYLYGYNFENRLYNINTLLETRYYFNFIEAKGTFENINKPLSAEIKQLINDTLEKGLTIWHVRDEDFIGVKNYSYDNVEMEIINND